MGELASLMHGAGRWARRRTRRTLVVVTTTLAVIAGFAIGLPSASAAGSFSMTLYPNANTAPLTKLIINPSKTTVFLLEVTPSGGFTNNVTFVASGLPANLKATFSPTTVPGTGLVFVSITATAVENYGNFPFTITGTGSAASGTATANGVIEVTPAIVPQVCTAAVSGTVTDTSPNHVPIAGAAVTVGTAATTTDAQGHYELDGAALGQFNGAKSDTLTATLDPPAINHIGTYWSATSAVKLGCGHPLVANLQMAKVAKATLTGTVFEGELAADQVTVVAKTPPKPVTDVRATITPLTPAAYADTNETGRFTFGEENGPAGFHLNQPTASNPNGNLVNSALSITTVFGSTSKYWPVANYKLPTPITDGLDVKPDPQILVVRQCTALMQVTVKDETGKLLDKANVTVTPTDTHAGSALTLKTDATGVVTFPAVPFGVNNKPGTLKANAQLDNFDSPTNPVESEQVNCGTTGHATVVLTHNNDLVRYGTITGKVVDAAAPATGLGNIPIKTNCSGTPNVECLIGNGAKTLADGTFVVSKIPLGTLTTKDITVQTNQPNGDYWDKTTVVTVVENPTLSPAEPLALVKRKFATIKGKVSDAKTGNPINGATMSGFAVHGGCTGNTCKTDATGNFTLNKVELQQDNEQKVADLTATANGYWPAKTNVTINADDVKTVDEFKLLPVCTTTINGFVQNAITKEPVEGVAITGITNTTTGADGKFTLSNVKLDTDNKPKTYALTASKTPGFNQVTKSVTVTANPAAGQAGQPCGLVATILFGELQEQIAEVGGTVTNGDTGLGIAGVKVTGSWGGLATTGADGKYAFAGDQRPAIRPGDPALTMVATPPDGSGLDPLSKSNLTFQTATPNVVDFAFDPSSLTVTVDNDANRDGTFSDSETVPGTATYPRVVTYRATIKNSTAAALTASTVVDDKTATLTTGAGTTAPGGATQCSTVATTSIAAGATVTCYYDVSLAAPSANDLVNTLTVTSGALGSGKDTSTVKFEAAPSAPTVTGVSPVSGPIAGGTVVTVTGTNLTGATGVSFGGSAGTSLSNVTATSLTITSPAHAVGPVDVTVTTGGGTSATSPADTFTYEAPPAVPVVTGVSPASGPVAGGTEVTITGSGFTNVSAVSFGGAVASFTFQSDTSVKAISPAHAVGPVDVTVTTGVGTSVVSAADTFTYTDVPPPGPTVASVSPASGPIAGGTVVTVTGTNLTGATGVSFGGSAGTSLSNVTATSLTITSPAHAVGPVDVTVTTGVGTSPISAADTFTYTDVPPPGPTVASVSPASGPIAGGTVVTVTGTNLTGATGVSFGGSAGTSLSNVTATSLTITSPAHAVGPVDVTVTTGVGTSPISAADTFTYTDVPPPGPTVASVSPASGPIAGGTEVTITGTNFTGVSGVSFGGSAATFTFQSATSIKATAPAHAVGPVDVTVTTGVGTSPVSAADKFTYTDVVQPGAPTVVGFAPGYIWKLGGFVTIMGTNLTGATSVTFGGVPAKSITPINANQLLVNAPAHDSGTVDVIVTTPGGSSAVSAASKFVYTVPSASEQGLINLILLLQQLFGFTLFGAR